MRVINVLEVTAQVEKLCKDANYFLKSDILDSYKLYLQTETFESAKMVLSQIIKNAEVAKDEEIAICQDTGMVVVFAEIGQDVHIENGLLEDAINQGIREGYEEGFLRKSVVEDPLNRKNTGDNTPGVIHYNIVEGDQLKIMVAPKGFGSENMSRLKMLKPSDGIEGVKEFILETVELAGPNACPPMIVGIGIGWKEKVRIHHEFLHFFCYTFHIYILHTIVHLSSSIIIEDTENAAISRSSPSICGIFHMITFPVFSLLEPALCSFHC